MRLGDVIQVNPESIGADYPHEEIEYIDISSVGTGTREATKSMPLDEAPSRAKRIVKNADTLLATVRPNLRTYLYVKQPSANTIASTGFAVLRASESIDARFLYYTVSNQPFTDYLTANTKGAAYPAVDTDTIERAEIYLPGLSVQQKIAAILSSYDDLIENNLQRIKVLEEMAQNLYREWFVKFRFPNHQHVRMIDSTLGKIPEEWKVARIDDVAMVHRGRSYRSKNLLDEGGLPFVNLKCIDRDGGFRRDGIKHYEGQYKETQKVVPGDIVMAVTDMTQERRIVARTGRVPTLDDDFGVISMDLVKIEPKKGVSQDYLYSYFRYSEFANNVKQHANGANVLHLSPERIKEYQFVLPSENVRERYKAFSAMVFQQTENLNRRVVILRQTRDLLLPKLVSGELDVSELEIDIGDAA